MKIHIRPGRRETGYRVAFEYTRNGQKEVLKAAPNFNREGVKAIVLEGAQMARDKKKRAG